LAIAEARVFTIPALMLNRSSRVIPGFLGTPAGMITTSDPSSAFPNSFSSAYPTTYGTDKDFRQQSYPHTNQMQTREQLEGGGRGY